MENDPLTEKIIGCCYDVHTKVGPGFNEKIYRRALKLALKNVGLDVEEEKSFKVDYNGISVGSLRLDLLVNNVIIEVKAVMGIMPKVFEQQIIAYLKATGLMVGLLVNFGNKSCKVRRLCNNHCNHNKESL